ncbi:hypothetical protein [Oceanobacillus sojae]|uniref:hypothetical protein n=1 Tax=Oceanobacillus sojae TaxID=582851 RepID=UPI000988303B|nr:hypothetical protein [Oceanobacillus sojae]MCT1904628.1 hypothetical protein [Oceanobacillus sojae]
MKGAAEKIRYRWSTDSGMIGEFTCFCRNTVINRFDFNKNSGLIFIFYTDNIYVTAKEKMWLVIS